MPKACPHLNVSRLEVYWRIAMYEWEIYQKMNCVVKSQTTEQLVGGFFWCSKNLDWFKELLGMKERHLEINLQECPKLALGLMPPTSFYLNEFTEGF